MNATIRLIIQYNIAWQSCSWESGGSFSSNTASSLVVIKLSLSRDGMNAMTQHAQWLDRSMAALQSSCSAALSFRRGLKLAQVGVKETIASSPRTTCVSTTVWKEPWLMDSTKNHWESSDLTLVGVHVGLEREDFSVATARSSVQVQACQELHVPHSCCVHLHQVLHPAGLLLRALQGRKADVRRNLAKL